MYLHDTIAAISTPLGEGGIGVIRVSGGLAATIGENLFSREISGGFESHRFYYGSINDPINGESLEEAMVVLMKGPRSYTREDVLEIQCHGGYLMVQRVLELVLRNGARLAEPGEFTRRAFLNGRIDLVQAEAVIDIIRSKTESALNLAQHQSSGLLSRELVAVREGIVNCLAIVEAHLDFPEEDLGQGNTAEMETAMAQVGERLRSLIAGFDEGKALREGVSVVIAGKPNAGKSSLLNTLLREKRAIVTSHPGTTRDVIEEVINIRGLPVRLLDTAGVCETDDPVEWEGVVLALEKVRKADLVLFLLDASRPIDRDDLRMEKELDGRGFIAVLNKCDLPEMIELPAADLSAKALRISTKSGYGIEELKTEIHDYFLKGETVDSREFVAISNIRQRDALVKCNVALGEFKKNLETGGHLEILAEDLRNALAAVGEVTGEATPDEVLDTIFQRFCIGK